MCGIFGGISFDGTFFPDREELEWGSHFLKYRGPDDQGHIFVDGGNTKVSLAHRRLSIIDLSAGGRQPMASSSGKSIITFNGEIYNYRVLRQELEREGFRFNTSSDTEVILNAYECWGIDTALRRIDGMFAFALFDQGEQRLVLARDRFGKKPLYFFSDGAHLAFGSDIRSLMVIRSVRQSVNLHALGYFFAELSTPSEQSVWSNVSKLRPATYLAFGSSGVEAYRSYWELVYSETNTLPRSELLERTDELLTNAVRKRLVADVDVSAMLSGGIDSSLVVAKMASAGSLPVKTYSVGFEEQAYNELPYSRNVARRFGTSHTEIVLRSDHLLDIDELIGEFGEPFADVSMVPTHLVSKEISKREKVVVGGDGGDELFGGYYSYYFAHKYDQVKDYYWIYPIAKTLRAIYPSYRTDLLVALLRKTRLPRYDLLNRNMGFETWQLKRLLGDEQFYGALEKEHKDIWEQFSPGSKSDLINLMSTSLRTRLLNDYLVKVDRSSMFASLEVRSPFLDKDLCEFVATFRASDLLDGNRTKSVLKDIASKYFDSAFVNRNKMGFGVPVGEWFKKGLKKRLQEVVLGGRQRLVDLDYSFVEEIVQQHSAGRADHTHRLWALYVFHVWANKT